MWWWCPIISSSFELSKTYQSSSLKTRQT
jgi:hypothetical protein